MSERRPRISVIVPVYNTERYLRRCLDSLVAQTIEGIEVVVVDDGSDDASPAIIDHYAECHRGLFTVVRKQRGGRADARNAGVALARGEFLGFVDSDDWAEPEMFELLSECAERTGADVVVCEYESEDERTGQRHHHREGAASEYGASMLENPRLMLEIGASVCNKLIRHSIMREHGIEFPTGLDFEDLATSYRVLVHAAHIEKVERVLYHYRLGHGSSVMSACDESYLHLPEALGVVDTHFADHGLLVALGPQLEEANLRHLFWGRFADFFLWGPQAAKTEYVERAFEHLDRYFPGWRARVAASPRGWFARLVVRTKPLLKAYVSLPPGVGIRLSTRLGMFTTIDYDECFGPNSDLEGSHV